MSNEYGKSRARLLSCAAVLGFSVSVSACSNGFSRIDQLGLADSVAAPNQMAQTQTSQLAAQTSSPITSQPLPRALNASGGVDNTYTSSVSPSRYQRSTQPHSAALLGGLRPSATIGGAQPVAQITPVNGYPAAPYPYQAPATVMPQYSAPALAPAMPARHMAPATAPMALGAAAQSVARQPLASLTTASVQPTLSQGQSTLARQMAAPVKRADRLSSNIDNVTTSSVKPALSSVASHPATAGDWNGWSRIGGTTIDVQAGETVYNLSKRYGVPPQAILGVNGISDASQLQRGSRIVIPVYQFSRQASVSAPDASAKVQAASSSTGYANKLPQTIEAPRTSPQVVSNIVTSGVASNLKPVAPNQAIVKPQPMPVAIKPVAQNQTPNAGVYKVVPGDTLYSVARRHKVSVQSLMQGNALVSSSLQVGQSLRIPQSGVSPASAAKAPPVVAQAKKPIKVQGPAPVAPKQTASVQADNVDPVTTASTPPLPKPTASGISTLRWPVRGRVVNGFGDVVAGKRNNGIDISVPEGTGVKAAENGVVLYAGNELAGYGNLVLLKHPNGIVTAYAHNSEITVRRGQKVSRGDTIAKAGRTGTAETPKLHFEVRKNSVPVNPIRYLGG